MSEVKRYAVIETALCIGGNLHEGEVLMIRADEHDRELSALREELAESGRADHLRQRISFLTSEIHKQAERLTAAEQRNATLEILVRQFQGVAYGGFLDDDHLLRMQRDIDAALTKPTESGASE